MPSNQDFMELRLRNDEDGLINGLKWSNDYFDHDHVQIVPEIHKEEENSKNDLLVVVPDEHSETGDHHRNKDYSDSSDSRWYLKNKHEKLKRRRLQLSSDEESEGFSREVPSVTRSGSKRRRRDDEMMSNKMRTLQQLVPNCHKMDNVTVLDKTIEYMKNLQLQLRVMSIMGMKTPYIPPPTLNFGMQHHLLTAMTMAHGLNPANQTMSSLLVPVSNWLLPPFNQSIFLTPSLPASSPQCLCSLVPCFQNLSSHTMGRL